MNKKIIFLFGMFVLLGIVSGWTPPGDIILQNYYKIINATTINSQNVTSELYCNSTECHPIYDFLIDTSDNSSWNQSLADSLYRKLSVEIDWVDLQNYPVACPSGSAITELGDSVICSTFDSFGDIFVNETGDIMSGDLDFDENADILLDARNDVTNKNGSVIRFLNDTLEVGQIYFNYFPTGQVLGLTLNSSRSLNLNVPSSGVINLNGRTRWGDDDSVEFGAGAFDKGDYEIFYNSSQNIMEFRGGNVLINPRSVVFNSYNSTMDHIFHGTNDNNLFFINSSVNRIGIGLADPETKLEVNGNITAKSYFGDASQMSGLPVDTSAYVNCTSDEVFLGNGSCYGTSNFSNVLHNHNGSAGMGEIIPHNATQPSRSLNTVYQNTKNRPIIVYGSIKVTATPAQSAYVKLETGSSNPPTTVVQKVGNINQISVEKLQRTLSFGFYMVVQPQDYYRIRSTASGGTVTLEYWNEVDF